MTLLHNPQLTLALPEADRQRLTAALADLPPVLHQVFLSALSHVDPQTLSSWLGAGTLQEWSQQGFRLFADKGEQFAGAFFTATPAILPTLSHREISEWMRVCLEIATKDELRVFSALPDDLTTLAESERLSFYRLVRTVAFRSPSAGAALYRSLPHHLSPLPATEQGLLLRCLQAAATFEPDPLPALVPFLGPTLRALPSESRVPLLERIAHMAQIFPAGVARLFRVLTRAYDEVGEEGIRSWIVTGEEVARRNPQAGEAFFALESRTSLLALRHASPAVSLDEVQGLLLKYLHMISGSAVSLTASDSLSFPPPLAAEMDAALPLPACVEVFPTYEENFRLYRVLAAHQAGRLEFGTYTPSLALLWSSLPSSVHPLLGPDAEPVNDLGAYFQLFPVPAQIEALFLFIEGKRITARLAAQYRGLREDLAWAESLTHLFPPALKALLPSLSDSSWLDLHGETTVYDSLLRATELYVSLGSSRSVPRPVSNLASPEEQEDAPEDAATALPMEVEDDRQEPTRLSTEEQAMLRKILAALRSHPGRKKAVRKRTVTVAFDMDDSDISEQEEDLKPRKKKATDRRVHTTEGLRYLYDEWDYRIEDYRTQWCQLRELPLFGDDGAFFSRTLASYAHLTPEIKREFQRLRPRQYRQVKGLEDGEEIDLEAAVTARVDRRTGTAPSPKLYAARQPLERDVAALFLLDMSASTDTQLAERQDLRVIDVMKEAVVLLSTALEDIGDVYAIYGFSSHGKRNVEVYPVKTFVDSLSPEVKSRIGGIEPQRSTRMGTAVRHATRKLKDLSCRAKLLVLLSDGCPEDVDYGRDKDAPTYGLRDTMMAFREAEKQGILSFCLTVDKGGNDYLREMCSPSRYMVIEDVLSLPVELPKIYQRHIRSQQV